jgi:hypothetical protein
LIFPAKIAFDLATRSSVKARSDHNLGDRANGEGNGKKDFFEKKG